MTTLLELTRARLAGSRGRVIREASGLSLRDMAAEIGVNPATLARWERGKFLPRRSAAIRWARLLDDLARVISDQSESRASIASATAQSVNAATTEASEIEMT